MAAHGLWGPAKPKPRRQRHARRRRGGPAAGPLAVGAAGRYQDRRLVQCRFVSAARLHAKRHAATASPRRRGDLRPVRTDAVARCPAAPTARSVSLRAASPRSAIAARSIVMSIRGFTFRGPLAWRPEDIVGIAFAYGRISPDAAANDRALAALTGVPMPIRDYEAAIELTYRWETCRGLVHPAEPAIHFPSRRQYRQSGQSDEWSGHSQYAGAGGADGVGVLMCDGERRVGRAQRSPRGLRPRSPHVGTALRAFALPTGAV